MVADRQVAWAPLAAEQKVELTIHPTSATPVWAVPGALEQALDNLLANAVRVAPVGSRVELAIRPAGGWVELHVTDQGPGMPADQRQRAFDRFWRGPPRQGGHWARAGHRPPAPRGQRRRRRAAPNPGGGLDAVARLRPADHGSRTSHQPTRTTTSGHADQ